MHFAIVSGYCTFLSMLFVVIHGVRSHGRWNSRGLVLAGWSWLRAVVPIWGSRDGIMGKLLAASRELVSVQSCALED